MSTVAEIVKAVERLDPEDFLKLRSALERVEERLWDRELRRVTAKQRKAKLTDAKIDELVLKRRHKRAAGHEGRVGHHALGFLLHAPPWFPASAD